MASQNRGGWGPIQRNGSIFTLTPNKRFDLTPLFPSSLKINNRELLTAPIEMFVKAQGYAAEKIAGSGTWTSTTPGECVSDWNWASSHYTVTGTRKVDDDGAMVYNLRVTPLASVLTEKLYLQIPLDPALTDYLLTFPHADKDPHNASQEFTNGVWSWEWSSTVAGDTFWVPGAITCHNGNYGMNFISTSDKNYGCPVWGAQSFCRFTVTQATGIMLLEFIAGPTPFAGSGNIRAPMDYELILYPMPARNRPAKPWRWNMPSYVPNVADYGTPAEEGTTTPYKMTGSALPRETGSQYDWSVRLAQYEDNNVKIVPYTIGNCWADADTELPFKMSYQPESGQALWYEFLNPPYTFYKIDGTGADYSIRACTSEDAEYRGVALQRWKDTKQTLGGHGLYFDVAQPMVVESSLDSWGRTCTRRNYISLREFMRDAYEEILQQGGIVMAHPQADMIGYNLTPCADVWNPGEEKRQQVIDTTDLAARKRFWQLSVTEYQKRAEWCPVVAGCSFTLLPYIEYNANNALTDRNSSGGTQEFFATEVMYGEALLAGGGVFHGFCDNTIMTEINLKLFELGLIYATDFRPYHTEAEPFAVTATPGVFISGWRQVNHVTLILVNRNSTDVTADFDLYREPVDNNLPCWPSTGLSQAEGRTTRFSTQVVGQGRHYAVDIVQNGFVFVEFDLPMTEVSLELPGPNTSEPITLQGPK